MLEKIRQLAKVEKVLVAFLALIALISGFQVVRAFYIEHSDITVAEGGTYTEGVVGKVGTINPLFVQQGSIASDITQLIFSGLTKYDPKSGEIVPDLADFKISENGKEYTFVIKEGALWHDGQPVTSDDVLFTYETVIANPDFKGFILNYNDYRGVKSAKIDERTVKFLLEKPDSFFLVKTMTGLLPEHLLENIPPSLISESPFSLQPIGSGRYRFISMLPVNNYMEISLSAFSGFYDKQPHIDNIIIKVFQDEKELIKHLGGLDGLRYVSAELADKILKKGRLVLYRYHLPQYVAVFINTESPILKNKKIRLALQLGTDKESLVKAIGESQVIDTPLLEIDQGNWVHQYSIKKANGALFDTEWKLPEAEEIRDQGVTGNKEEKTEEKSADESHSYINGPNGGRDWQTTDNKVTITGTAPAKTKAIMVNDYELSKFTPGERAWTYVASVEFGNLKKRANLYEVYGIDFNENKTLLDSITITYGNEEAFFMLDKEKLSEENELAYSLPTRVNGRGESLTLRLITTETPPSYAKVAEILKKQWKNIGVTVEIEVLENAIFQNRLRSKDYDLLLFGQNLGYNLDAYPYWHSSQAGGFNLSQFRNFAVDSLLEEARLKTDAEDRKKTLNAIQKIMSTEVPAVFLYSPTYQLAQSSRIQNNSFEGMSTVGDRFAGIEEWYGRSKRKLKDGVGIFTLFKWLIKQF